VKQMSGQAQEELSAYFGLAAGLRPPWRVSQYAMDSSSRSLHLWVTQEPEPQVPLKRSWFGLRAVALAPRPVLQEGQVWRHVDCMGYAAFIHTPDTLHDDDQGLDWLGPRQMPFTHGLSRKVFALLSEGLDLPVVCELLRIQFADLWKFKYALDNGLLPFEFTPLRRFKPRPPTAPVSASSAFPFSLASSEASPSQPAPLADVDGVPDLAEPVWEQLITGELTIQIKTLGFQLLLSKLRQQVSMQHNDEVKLMKLRDLHRYVQRHERVLGHELAQIQRHLVRNTHERMAPSLG
jgi:hypothetical protein